MRPRTLNIIKIVVIVSMSCVSAAWAQEGASLDVQAELKALRDEVSALRAKSEQNWLTERRAEEVKALIREVLADADTRSSLSSSGVTAGHDGKNFFMASQDGNFLLKFDGHLQTRYIFNHSDGTTGDVNESGFQQRRAKIGFAGHVYDPALTYKLKAGFERSGGAFILEEAWLRYAFCENYFVQVGQFKGPFLHEELVSSTKQLTAERSNVNEFFTLDYSQGVAVGAVYNNWNWTLMVHDGREADNVDFAADSTDLAVAGRVEYLVAGSMKQFDDFVPWSKDPGFGVMVGGAVDYENGEGGTGSAFDWEHMVQYTGDISVEMFPFGFYFAYVGRTVEYDPGQGPALSAGSDDAHQWGLVAQGSIFLVADKWDVFVRYEHLDYDAIMELTGTGSVTPLPPAVTTVAGDTQDIYTFGTNYYFKKHNLKATLDLQWAPDGIRAGESGSGNVTSNADKDDQLVGRAQIQLVF